MATLWCKYRSAEPSFVNGHMLEYDHRYCIRLDADVKNFLKQNRLIVRLYRKYGDDTDIIEARVLDRFAKPIMQLNRLAIEITGTKLPPNANVIRKNPQALDFQFTNLYVPKLERS